LAKLSPEPGTATGITFGVSLGMNSRDSKRNPDNA
jgi:hypothetical protein